MAVTPDRLTDRTVILVNGTDLLHQMNKAKRWWYRLWRKPLPAPPAWLCEALPIEPTTSELASQRELIKEETDDDHATLYESLAARIAPAHIHQYVWDGRNSDLARLKAAAGLADDICTVLDQRPGHDVVVVAHSHGGNVALYARNKLKEARSPDDLARVKIITLSTPFLAVFREGVGAIYWGGVVPVGVALFVWLARNGWWPDTPIWPLTEVFTFTPRPVVIGLLAWFAWLGTSIFGWIAYRRMWRDPSSRLEERIQELDLGELQPADGVSVVKTTADEAEGLLVGLLLAAWLGLLFTQLARLLPVGHPGDVATEPRWKLIQRWLIRGFLIALAIVPAIKYQSGLDPLWWLFAVPSFLILLGSVVRWFATALGLGPMHAPLIWFYGTSVESVPDGSVPVRQVALGLGENRDAYKLSHSSYENPECIKAVLDFMNLKPDSA